MISGNLVIKPVSANLTYSTEFFGSMDCYAKITVGSNVFKTKPAHDQGKNPNWQENFQARVNGDQSMHVAIYDQDDGSKDDYVGECQVPIGEVYQRRQCSNWYNIVRKGKSIGQIMIVLEFYPDGGAQMGMQPGMGMGMQPQMGMGMGMQPQMGMGMQPQMGMGMGMQPQMGMGMQPQMGMGMGMQPGMGGMGMGGGMGMNPGMGGMGGMGGGYGY